MMPENNCRGCSRRYVGCHAVCDSYNNFKRALEERKETIRKEREENRIGYHFTNFGGKRRFS